MTPQKSTGSSGTVHWRRGPRIVGEVTVHTKMQIVLDAVGSLDSLSSGRPPRATSPQHRRMASEDFGHFIGMPEERFG
jgi:hypothetical protein